MKVAQTIILSMVMMVSVVTVTFAQSVQNTANATTEPLSPETTTYVLTEPLQQKTNSLIEEMAAVALNIDKAIEALRQARTNRDIYAGIDKGQSQVRTLLDAIKEDGIFVKEIQMLLEERQVELAGYESLKISQAQRDLLSSEEKKFIAGFQQLLGQIAEARKELKALDETFSSTRTFVAKLLGQKRVGVALEIAKSAVSSLKETVAKTQAHMKGMVEDAENAVTTE